MTEVVLGTVFIILLIVALTTALILARGRLIPPGAVAVTVNGGKQIDAARGDQLLAVLHGAGIAIPAACGGAGTCGLCRVAVEGEGLGDLLGEIGTRAIAAAGTAGDILPSRLRHVELLQEARAYLLRALQAEDTAVELRAEDLRLAADRLGRIVGAVDVEDLLDVIFSQFCIGK